MKKTKLIENNKKLLILSSFFILPLTACFNPFSNTYNQTNFNLSSSNIQKFNRTSSKQSETQLFNTFKNKGTVIPEISNIKLDGFNQSLIPILDAANYEKFNNIHIPNYIDNKQEEIANNILGRTISINAILSTKNNNVLIPWQETWFPWFRPKRNQKQEVSTSVSGTGWIIAKANNNENDYTYYVATNIHVSSSFISLLNTYKKDTNKYNIDYTFSPPPYYQPEKIPTKRNFSKC